MTTELDLLIILFATSMLLIILIYEKKRKNIEREEIKSQEKLEERLTEAGINDIDLMNGFEFEQYLELLFKRLGIRARRTQGSNDFGADLILEGKERVVVQAKRYQKKVGIRAVQEINSARNYYNAQEAWVITNSFFTRQAIELANSTHVKLIDRYELVELILNSNLTLKNKKLW